MIRAARAPIRARTLLSHPTVLQNTRHPSPSCAIFRVRLYMYMPSESLCARFPRCKGKEPIKLATRTAQERLTVLRLTGIITNPLDDEGANAMAQLASTSEEWKQQRTRRNLRPVSYTHLTLPTKRIV